MEPDDEAARLTERLGQATLGFFDVLTIYAGQKLGLYESLAAAGPLTSDALAARTSTHPRYVREWLEQQAVSGLLAVDDDPEAPPESRRYRLPAGHARVLVLREDPLWQGTRPHSLLSVARRMPALLEAFRQGGGVSSADHDHDSRTAQASLGQVAYLSSMGAWMAALPDVDARLRREPAARVVDLGCGAGWSAIALARQYPLVSVDGFDLDPASVALARENAAASGVAERARFESRDAGDPTLSGSYELGVVFEALHDMPRPVEALRTLRRLAGETGAVLVVDLKVSERFSAPGDDLARFTYGWSVLSCLASGMTGPEPAGTGAVMRPQTLRAYAASAGFAGIELLPVPHEGWSFYRLR